jgi:hypothetical protein
MTEYDYSPEAYDRYLRTQHRIAQWVDNTEAHRPEFDASLLPTRPGHRSTRSMHDVLHYPPRPPSSSSSSSSEPDPPTDIPRSMQHVPGLHPMYQHQHQQPAAALNASRKRPRTRRRSSSHHHHRPRRSIIQPYIVSPPPNTPEHHPYGYTVNGGTLVSPGPYGFSKGSHMYAVSPPHSGPNSPPLTYYNSQQAAYPFPQSSYTSPTSPGAYPFYTPQNAAAYMSGQQQQGNPYMYTAAAGYPPMMYQQSGGAPVYPVQSQHGMQSVMNPKPLFYQRIFRQGKKSKSTKSSSR